MSHYDDDVRKADAIKIQVHKGYEAKEIPNADLYDALAVFVLDPKLRPVLWILDPKSIEQARKALGLTS